MRVYHDDYLTHLVEAAFCKHPKIKGANFSRAYNARKGGWSIYRTGYVTQKLFIQERFWSKDDADYILARANAFAASEVA